MKLGRSLLAESKDSPLSALLALDAHAPLVRVVDRNSRARQLHDL